jgi:hypothetical protein
MRKKTKGKTPRYEHTKAEKEAIKKAAAALKILKKFAKKYYGYCKKDDYCMGCISCLLGRALDDIEGVVDYK